MALFDIASNLRAPGQLQFDDCTQPSPWGSLKSYLSRQMPVRFHAAELTVNWRSTDRLLSPMRTYCVLGYLLLERHSSATLIRTAQTITLGSAEGGGWRGEGRVEVTEMIKGFLFCFENFHHGISLGIGKFGKYKYI